MVVTARQSMTLSADYIRKKLRLSIVGLGGC